jgi:hypothetical protein
MIFCKEIAHKIGKGIRSFDLVSILFFHPDRRLQLFEWYAKEK